MTRRAVLRHFLPIAAAALSLSGCAGAPNSGSSQSAGCAAGAKQETSEAGLDQVILCLRSGSKTRAFAVEMAVSPQEQQQGLMFRTTLADDRGMLFPFAQPRIASFWMRNTLIPLDIIFVGSDGRIVNIAENATPYSLEPVVSIAPVTAVLELRGGLTAQLGIKAGDSATWEAGKGR